MSNQQRLRPSEGVDEYQLALARKAGDAYQEAAEYMMEEVADDGGNEEVGDYLVGFAQEKAEGLYRMEDGDLSWAEPPEGANCHLEVVVASAADRRFLPGASVTATFEGDDGTDTIPVEVEPPSFPRHDRENGKRFADPVEVQFEDVDITTDKGSPSPVRTSTSTSTSLEGGRHLRRV